MRDHLEQASPDGPRVGRLRAVFKLGRLEQPAYALPAALAIFLACSMLFPPIHSLWLDETASFYLASLPWADVLEIIGKAEANMSLYYLLLKLHLLGGFSSPLYIRALSALFSLLAIAAMYFFCSQYINRRVALCVAVVAAFNPFIYLYSWEARSYSLTLLFGTLMLWLFWLCLSENRRSHWLLYGLVAGIGLYSHIFLTQMVVAQTIFAIGYISLHQSWSRSGLRLLLALCVIAVVASPLLYFFCFIGINSSNLDWIKPVGIASTWSFLKNILKTNHSWEMLTRVLSVLLLVSCAGISAYIAGREFYYDRKSRRAHLIAYLACCTLLPVLMTYELQAFKPMFLERYLIFVAPAFLILCCWSFLSLPGRRLQLAALGVLCITQVYGMVDSHRADKYAYDRLYRDMAVVCKPGSTLVFTYAAVSTTYHYYQNIYPRLSQCFSKVLPESLNHGEFNRILEFDELPRATPGEQLWVVDGHVYGANKSIYLIHDPSYLGAQGYRPMHYQKYPLDLTLIRLASREAPVR